MPGADSVKVPSRSKKRCVKAEIFFITHRRRAKWRGQRAKARRGETSPPMPRIAPESESRFAGKLMMEKPHAGESHHNPVLVAHLNHIVVTNAAARLGNHADSAFVRPLNVVAEREERIAS